MAKALNGSGNIIVITTDVIRPARDRSTGFKEVMKNYPVSILYNIRMRKLAARRMHLD